MGRVNLGRPLIDQFGSTQATREIKLGWSLGVPRSAVRLPPCAFPDGVAQAFELSMVAKKGAPNQAPKAPPWDGFWVGDNYYLEIGETR